MLLSKNSAALDLARLKITVTKPFVCALFAQQTLVIDLRLFCIDGPALMPCWCLPAPNGTPDLHVVQVDLHRRVPGTDETCLLLASAGSHTASVAVLLKYGACVADKDIHGDTPLLKVKSAYDLHVSLSELLQRGGLIICMWA